MNETLSIKGGTVETVLEVFWSKTWCDVTIKAVEDGEVTARVFLACNPETLRTIGEQLYSWADTIEAEWQEEAG